MDDLQSRVRVKGLERMLMAAFLVPGTEEPDVGWRIRQLQRMDWPDTLSTDNGLRRGYTMRQVMRVLSAIALMDAKIGPTDAVRLARDNENTLLTVIASGLPVDPPTTTPDEDCAPPDQDAEFGRHLVAVLRPMLLATSDRAHAPFAERIDLVHADDVPKLLDGEDERAVVTVRLAKLASRAIEALAKEKGFDERALRDVLTLAAIATERDEGYVPTGLPTGDRYVSPRRRRVEAG